MLPPVKIVAPLQGYVNYNFKQNQFETTLKLLFQSFAIFTKIGSPNANIVKDNIARCREKMTEEQFKAILKEFE
ncbi:MAG TPA: hypothetical protein VK469_17925 [Candidatus Kapabacteria bacterium]|nr:hypothetical protein [Candidatus Kapabacteria bacterium]